MIHIVKTKRGQFQAVVISSKNGEVLHASEPETRKYNVWNNIWACATEWNTGIFNVQDDTTQGEPVVYQFQSKTKAKVEMEYYKPEPRYIAGRNPKTRTK